MHRNLVAGLLEALEWSFGKDVYIDKVLEQLFRKNRRWGKRDRSFISEHAYTIVRNWRLLWHLTGTAPSLKRKDLWKLFVRYVQWKALPLPDWKEFEDLQDWSPPSMKGQSVELQESYPDWLAGRAQKELGAEDWEPLAKALNEPPQMVGRTNTLRMERAELLQRLKEEGANVLPWEENETGLLFKERISVARLNSFAEGLFEIQDGGSQQIAPLLQVEAGMRVIDACAGAGGKSLHLAALMKNKGQIQAMDVDERKLHELQRRAKQQGVGIIDCQVISGTALRSLDGCADRLLLDVPCSGTGVIKRKPDTKWKLKPEYLDNILSTQSEILDTYSSMLRPGGLMVYATCSILPSENEEQVRSFLQQRLEFELIHQERIPPRLGSDGYFAALIKKS
jgi:16S rRNA (cytosine967-C5)-methyltransferase